MDAIIIIGIGMIAILWFMGTSGDIFCEGYGSRRSSQSPLVLILGFMLLLSMTGVIPPISELGAQQETITTHRGFVETAEYYQSLEPTTVQQKSEITSLLDENNEMRQRISDLESLKIGTRPSIWTGVGQILVGMFCGGIIVRSYMTKKESSGEEEKESP